MKQEIERRWEKEERGEGRDEGGDCVRRRRKKHNEVEEKREKEMKEKDE